MKFERRQKMKEITSLIAVTVAVLLFLGVNCYGGDNEIYGCYQKNGGDLRIVKHPKSCRHSEIPISWNKVGPQGPIGPAGPQGLQGPQATLNPSEEFPKVYDAENQLLGISPSMSNGYLSFFVPKLSRFVSLSPYTGDVASYPSIQVYYDASGCNGNSYIDAGMRYQIMKLESKYIMADDVDAKCIDFKSVWGLIWSEMGGLYLTCASLSSGNQCNLLPSREVGLPFSAPVAQPVHIR